MCRYRHIPVEYLFSCSLIMEASCMSAIRGSFAFDSQHSPAAGRDKQTGRLGGVERDVEGTSREKSLGQYMWTLGQGVELEEMARQIDSDLDIAFVEVDHNEYDLAFEVTDISILLAWVKCFVAEVGVHEVVGVTLPEDWVGIGQIEYA